MSRRSEGDLNQSSNDGNGVQKSKLFEDIILVGYLVARARAIPRGQSLPHICALAFASDDEDGKWGT